MVALYTLGQVVDRICDTPIEFFIVHSPYVEQEEPGCESNRVLFLIFLSNVSFALMKSHYAIHDCICAKVYDRLSN
jgi:hypothetical protein